MIPKQIDYFKSKNLKIKSIAAGMYHSIALTTDNQMFSWGKGEHGVLGHGNSQFHLIPKKIEEFADQNSNNVKVVKIDAADEYTAA